MARPSTRIWDRQEGESDQQWQMFEIYLRERSNEAVIAQYYADREPATRNGIIVAIKKARGWERRCLAYDRWLAKQRDEAVTEVVKHTIRMISKKRLKVLDHLGRIEERVFQSVMPVDPEAKLRPADAVMYTKVAQALMEEYRKFEAAHPMQAEGDQPFQKEILGANERLLAFVAKSRAEAKADDSGAMLQ